MSNIDLYKLQEKDDEEELPEEDSDGSDAVPEEDSDDDSF